MEIYGFLQEGSIERFGESILGYRHVVMDYYNECVSRYDNILKVEICTKKFNRENNQKVEGMMCTVTLLRIIRFLSWQ